MTGLKQFDDMRVVRLVPIAGALLGVLTICAAVPLRGRVKSACRLL
ncbi:hypothetical protein ACFYYN_32635 [Streptomyces sp. NPDC001902]